MSNGKYFTKNSFDSPLQRYCFFSVIHLRDLKCFEKRSLILGGTDGTSIAFFSLGEQSISLFIDRNLLS